MKKFKTSISIFITLSFLCAFSLSSAAVTTSSTVKPMDDTSTVTSTGEALLNHFYYNGSASDYTWLYVHNITDNPINVSMTIYKDDGTILTDDGTSSTGLVTTILTIGGTELSNYSETTTGTTLTFTLNAHCSGSILLGSTTAASTIGYGVFNWSQEGTTYQGLVVSGYYGKVGTWMAPVSVNDGNPF
jgi:hypothetical protein